MHHGYLNSIMRLVNCRKTGRSESSGPASHSIGQWRTVPNLIRVLTYGHCVGGVPVLGFPQPVLNTG